MKNDMGLNPISAIWYYGGKSKMAYLIADMLDYDNTTIYLEPFGGGARTLLNKPRHSKEIYYEISDCVCSLFKVLSDPVKTEELVERLYNTDCNEEFFLECKKEFDYCDENFCKTITDIINKQLKYIRNRTKADIKKKTLVDVYDSFNLQLNLICLGISSDEVDLTVELEDINEKYKDIEISGMLYLISQLNIYLNAYMKNTNVQVEKYSEESIKEDIVSWKKRYAYINKITVDDLDQAEQYYKEFDAFERECLQNINVTDSKSKSLSNQRIATWKQNYLIENNIDAERLKRLSKYYKGYEKKKINLIIDKARIDFYNDDPYIKDYIDDQTQSNISLVDKALWAFVVYTLGKYGSGKSFSKDRFQFVDQYHKNISKLYEVSQRLQRVDVRNGNSIRFLKEVVDDPCYCIYCDPPYLQSKETIEKLIDKKLMKLNEYNPGQYYKDGWDRQKHIEFLNIIKNGKAKILVSNYTDFEGLYDQYLSEENGWKKIEYETKTTIAAGITDNYRTECLWYNY